MSDAYYSINDVENGLVSAFMNLVSWISELDQVVLATVTPYLMADCDRDVVAVRHHFRIEAASLLMPCSHNVINTDLDGLESFIDGLQHETRIPCLSAICPKAVVPPPCFGVDREAPSTNDLKQPVGEVSARFDGSINSPLFSDGSINALLFSKRRDRHCARVVSGFADVKSSTAQGCASNRAR